MSKAKRYCRLFGIENCIFFTLFNILYYYYKIITTATLKRIADISEVMVGDADIAANFEVRHRTEGDVPAIDRQTIANKRRKIQDRKG